MPDHPAGPDNMGAVRAITVLAFDYGLRHIGVAAGQTLTGTATPLPALTARDGIPNWDAVGGLIAEWKPQQLVVGLPLNMDGTDAPITLRARKFARRLEGRFGLTVALWDERLSSFEARGELMAASRGRQRDLSAWRAAGVDSVSARLILEGWLAAYTGRP